MLKPSHSFSAGSANTRHQSRKSVPAHSTSCGIRHRKFCSPCLCTLIGRVSHHPQRYTTGFRLGPTMRIGEEVGQPSPTRPYLQILGDSFPHCIRYSSSSVAAMCRPCSRITSVAPSTALLISLGSGELACSSPLLDRLFLSA